MVTVLVDALLRHPSLGVVLCRLEHGDLVVEVANDAALGRLGPRFAPGRRLGDHTPVGPHVRSLVGIARAGGSATVDLSGNRAPLPGRGVRAFVAQVQDGRIVLVVEGAGGDGDLQARWGEAMLESAVDVIFVLEASGVIRHATPGAWSLLDFAPHQLVGHDFRAVVDAADRLVVEEAFLDVLAARPEVPVEAEFRVVDGRERLRWVHARAVNRLGTPGVEAIVASLRDISVQRQLRSSLEFAATHDPLTGLANRVLLTDHLQLAVAAAARRSSAWIGVLFLDLDRFKAVNDSFGHGAGDHLLRQVAARLLDAVRPADTVARFGGDEFAVLCTDLPTVHEVMQLAERVRSAVEGRYSLPDVPHEVYLDGSMGVSLSGEPPADADAMLREADTALYEAKRRGRGQVQLFSARLRRSVGARLELEADLRAGVERGELTLQFQPKLELRSGEVQEAEALVRWRHPQRGLLRPVAFLDVADETGLLVPIGHRVLRAAARQAATWRRAGVDVGVCVNLSPRELAEPTLLDVLSDLPSETGVEPSRFRIEITEQTAVQDLASAVEVVGAIRDLGMGVALDDFGTGYSSLAWLQRLPVDTIKLDRSFTIGLEGDRPEPVVAAIIQLAGALGLRTVAEGVESAQQLERLRELGCDVVQGNHVAPPLDGDALPSVPLPLRRAGGGSV